MSHLRFFLSLTSVAVVAASRWASGAGIYLTPKNYPSGDFPVDVAVRDFNNDGFADIVSANVNDKTVSVFLNDGKGSFGPANTFTVGAGPNEVASADLDGDGNADLVVTDSNASVYIALGHGDGTFGAFTAINVPNHPRGIAIADLNGDGIPDLAVGLFGPTQGFAGQVAVLLGHGDSSFASPVLYNLNGVSATQLVATDLNNDGKLDLAVALQHGSHPTDGLAVLLGNGDGTFQPAVLSLKINATDVAAADLNGDGKMDLALTTSYLGLVEVVLGNGDGTFQPPVAYNAGGNANGGLRATVNVADMNGDGVPDLVYGSDLTAILLGDGSGGFGPPVIYGLGDGFARVGYLNRDHIPDMIANGGSGESAAAIAVAFGRPHGALTAARVFSFGEGLDATNSLVSADFDGDGHPDLVVGGSSELYFLHGNGDDTFDETVPFQDLQAVSLLTADFNGDGKQDLLATISFGFGGFYIILGNGDGTFQAPLTPKVGTPASEFRPAVSDFNHDGKTDVALADASGDHLYILLGNGDGTFQPEIQYNTPAAPVTPTVADFDGDGNLDLAVSCDDAGLVAIFLGREDGTFAVPLTFAAAGYTAAGDLNLDGKPDLVVGGGSGLQVYLGNGDGTFGAGTTVYPDYGPVQIADIDLDGRPDIVLTTSAVSYYTSSLVGLRGLGDGTFRPALVYPTGTSARTFVLKDLDGDGAQEAIVGSIFHWLPVLRNISHPR